MPENEFRWLDTALTELLQWFTGECTEVPSERWDDFAASDQSVSKNETKRSITAKIQELLAAKDAAYEKKCREARIDAIQFAQGIIRDALVPKSDVRKLTRIYAVDDLLEKYIAELHAALPSQPSQDEGAK